MKVWRVIGLSICLVGILSFGILAGPIPQGDTQISPLDKLNISMGIQYRVMYNYSNIPGPGGTTFSNTEPYDFFRQRLRLNVEMKPTENAGGFLQIEYRGGFGGSSPDQSDPRGGNPTVNPFNRLQARGVRYGYLYVAPMEGSNITVGILPISDQVGDTLFSADWDFNVGGIAYMAKRGPIDYRLAYLRLVDTVNSGNISDLDNDGNVYVADLNYGLDMVKLGAHIYYLGIGRVTDPRAPASLSDGRTDESWYGLTAAGSLGPSSLNGFFIINNGKTSGSDEHTGYAVKAEGSIPLGPAKGFLLFIYTTGDDPGKVDKRFTTIQNFVGTQGYWAYTHLFTANGPSDVNDLGVRIDNGGLGLLTLQGKLSSPIVARLSGDLIAGFFQAAKEKVAGGGKNMGTELAGMLTFEVSNNLNLQAGVASAFLGDDFFGANADDLYEVFSRFQLQF